MSDLDSHMALFGVKLDSRNLLNSNGLQVQLMQILQLLAEYGLQFKEHDKRIDENHTQIRELKCVTAAGQPTSHLPFMCLRPPCARPEREPGRLRVGALVPFKLMRMIHVTACS
jgi:hypothetical protein